MTRMVLLGLRKLAAVGQSIQDTDSWFDNINPVNWFQKRLPTADDLNAEWDAIVAQDRKDYPMGNIVIPNKPPQSTTAMTPLPQTRLPRMVGDWMLPRSKNKQGATVSDLTNSSGAQLSSPAQLGYQNVTNNPGYNFMNRHPMAAAPKQLPKQPEVVPQPVEDYGDDVGAWELQQQEQEYRQQEHQAPTHPKLQSTAGDAKAYQQSLDWGRQQKTTQDQIDRYNAMADANNRRVGADRSKQAQKIEQKPIHNDTLWQPGVDAQDQEKNRFSHIKMSMTNPDGSHRYFTRNAQGQLEEVSLTPEQQADYQQARRNTEAAQQQAQQQAQQPKQQSQQFDEQQWQAQQRAKAAQRPMPAGWRPSNAPKPQNYDPNKVKYRAPVAKLSLGAPKPKTTPKAMPKVMPKTNTRPAVIR
jgi:hypothetical protein